MQTKIIKEKKQNNFILTQIVCFYLQRTQILFGCDHIQFSCLMRDFFVNLNKKNINFQNYL